MLSLTFSANDAGQASNPRLLRGSQNAVLIGYHPLCLLSERYRADSNGTHQFTFIHWPHQADQTSQPANHKRPS